MMLCGLCQERVAVWRQKPLPPAENGKLSNTRMDRERLQRHRGYYCNICAGQGVAFGFLEREELDRLNGVKCILDTNRKTGYGEGKPS